MSRKLASLLLAMLVLAGAMSLKTLVAARFGNSLITAEGGAPRPPTPWREGGAPRPPTPWQ